MRIHKTKTLLEESLVRLNAIITEEQELAIYETVNDAFFAIVDPIFSKLDLVDIVDENMCIIIKELDIKYEEDGKKYVKLDTRELLPHSYIGAYIEYCEYEITKQVKRNMDMIKGLGIENIEIELLEKPDLYEQFFTLDSTLLY